MSESPTAQSVLLYTVISVAPAKAVAVNFVLTVVGAFPYSATFPVTTNILLPCSPKSKVYPESFFNPVNSNTNSCRNGSVLDPAVMEPALIHMYLALTYLLALS